VVEADEGEMLTLDTHHPPRSNEHLGLLLTFGEPSLKAPNSELRAIGEVVQTKFEESPTYTIQISKGNEKRRVPMFKRDLFAWLILSQLKLNQEDEVII